ncbi:hypothetical protein GALMADRAFT_1065265 [Galerina marginata CBS 339.88]|uniref:Uncharacterized protein n=1 Tax=Galerina marginata (strain CBS 339.88) TaxID=685588 RepID=A0A067SAG4_GALM3|nr:hypothetical protein GALMADRAFT_1065265 [Galerina marginata CBS 339.88]
MVDYNAISSVSSLLQVLRSLSLIEKLSRFSTVTMSRLSSCTTLILVDGYIFLLRSSGSEGKATLSMKSVGWSVVRCGPTCVASTMASKEPYSSLPLTSPFPLIYRRDLLESGYMTSGSTSISYGRESYPDTRVSSIPFCDDIVLHPYPSNPGPICATFDN